MNQYDVILWDVDDTLLDFGMSERHAFQVTAERFGWHPGEAEYRLYSDINNRHWKMLECGLITMEQVKYLRFEALFRELHMDSVSIQDFQEHYQEELGITDDELVFITKSCGAYAGSILLPTEMQRPRGISLCCPGWIFWQRICLFRKNWDIPSRMCAFLKRYFAE